MFASHAALMTANRVVGGSVAFDGSGDRLSISDSSLFDLSGQFTVECFFRFTAYESRLNTLVSKISLSEQGWLLRYTGTAMRWFGRGTTVDRSFTPSLGTWYHVAVSRDVNNDLRMFIDGTLQGSAVNTNGNFSESGVGLSIGASPAFGTDTYGYISNLRIIKGSAAYTSSFTKPSAPLTAIANTSILTCQSPTDITDASTNNFTITSVGNAAASSLSPF